MVNDYDKFAEKRQEGFRKGNVKLHRFVEKPMMEKMLPDLAGKKILMLGCGTGEEEELLSAEGTKLVGVDLSGESIRLAKESYPNHEFYEADMHDLSRFMDNEFDFVYSSLVIHYSATPIKVFQEVARILKPGGQFLFSVGHPLRWGSEVVTVNGYISRLTGYTVEEDKDANSQVLVNVEDVKDRVFGTYNTFTAQTHEFTEFGNETLYLYSGSPSTYYKWLKEAGFIIEDFVESQCVEEAKEHVTEGWYKRFREIPQVMGFLATRK